MGTAQSRNEAQSSKQDLKKTVTDLTAAIRAQERRNTNLHILFIGASGAGKTSLLNFFGQLQSINEDGLDRIVTDFKPCNDAMLERAPDKPMASKTSSTRSYDIKIGDVTLKITDTPGLGMDSDGMSKTKEHVKNIVEHLQKVDYVDCVCLAINGRTTRGFPEVKYALGQISEFLPNVAKNNMILCLTNCENLSVVTFDPNIMNDFFKNEIEQSKIFCIENPVCQLEKMRKRKLPTEGIEEAFEEALKELCRMLQTIKEFHPLPTTCFLEVYKAKQAVEREILAITMHRYNQTQLGILQTGKVKFTIISMIEDSHYNTLCDYPGCYSVCHRQCRLPLSFDTAIFKKCYCMRGSMTMCVECKHPYTAHYHQFVKFDRKEVSMEYNKIDEQIKKDTEQALQSLSDKIKNFIGLSNAKDYIQLLNYQSDIIKLHQTAYGNNAELIKAQNYIDTALQLANKII